MPVKIAIANDHNLIVSYFHGAVPLTELRSASDQIAAAARAGSVYRGLVVFERDVWLPEWTGAALKDMIKRTADVFCSLGLQRGKSAAVVNRVPEADVVIRLWNALCDLNTGVDMAFNVFWDLPPALAFLEVSPAVLDRVITEPVDAALASPAG
jgi:hypothetical protein